MIDALLFAQYDDDASVASAAVAALDRIHPDSDVALRLYGGGCYEEVVEMMIRPAYTTWKKVDGEEPLECWVLK